MLDALLRRVFVRELPGFVLNSLDSGIFTLRMREEASPGSFVHLRNFGCAVNCERVRRSGRAWHA